MIRTLKHSKSGFTLVELIVVIAILAILAGVAIPVYSGYIAKANEAADLQLLGALNTAFAASCLEMGLDPTQVVGVARLSGEAGGKRVESVTASGAGAVNLSSREAFNDVFLRYFGDNVNTPFKVYTSLGYDTANGVFVDGAKEYTFATVYGTVTITAAELSAYHASTFSEIGSGELLNNIDSLVNQAVLSLTRGNTSLEVETGYQAFLASIGMDYSSMTDQQKANALVLYVASKSDQIDVDAWTEAMSNGTTPEGIVTPGNINTPMVIDGAIQYAMMLAYARSSDNPTLTFVETTPGQETSLSVRADEIKPWLGDATLENYTEYQAQADAFLASKIEITNNGKRVTGVKITEPGTTTSTTENALEYFNNLDINSVPDVASAYAQFAGTDEFKSYAATQGASDLQGFKSALSAISNNISVFDQQEISDLLSNGYSSNTELSEMLLAILGG